MHQVLLDPSWLDPIGADALYGKFNLDGVVTYSKYNRSPQEILECPAYTQIFRDWSIEAIWTFPFQGYKEDKKIPSLAFENLLIDAIAYYFRKMEQLNVVTPIYVMISLLRVRVYKMVLLQLFKLILVVVEL